MNYSTESLRHGGPPLEAERTAERPRVALVSTHPIQYHTPWYRALARREDIQTVVLYCHEATAQDQAEAGFGVKFDWDIPLLDGYAWEFLPNVSSRPGVTFWGLDTPELSRRIACGEYDAVVVNGWHYKSAWQAMNACWRTGTPVLMRSDSQLRTHRNPVKAGVKWPLYRAFIPRLDSCLPVGFRSREYFLHYGARPDRIFEVPHIVDADRLAAEASGWEEKRAELRRRWDLPDDEIVFLFAGKFIDKKRPLDFVRAIVQGRAMGAQISGLMAGDGALRPACAAEAAASAAPVRFAGFLNQREIVQAYVCADALVLPSDGGETWGLVVNEAMVCGRPCFLSDQVGCAPDLIDEGQTGATFPCGDAGALAALLVRYADRRVLRGMGENARRKIEAYSPQAAAGRLALAVHSTLTRKLK
jgi:glycosyltransferase involved in cell wall biosynthesis